MPSKAYAVRVADGARLITSLSQENVGESNFTRILNMRRSQDRLIRREGWIKFVGEDEYVFDGSENLLRLAELVRPNGERVVVGASRTKIKRFNSDTGVWDDINGGLTFSSSGKRWQVSTLNGYLILNNTVNLPVSFRVEDDEVTPIYQMREAGFASVGRICEYNGFLCVGDITEIKAGQLAMWMNGYSVYTVGSTSAKVASFNTSTGAGVQYNVTTGASEIVASLYNATTPAMSATGYYVWLKKVDAGVGTVITSPVIADQEVVLENQNDMALIRWNGTQFVATVFPLGVIPADDPYGTPPSYITQRKPWAVANSEFGEPTGWAPAINAYPAAAGTGLNLDFRPHDWVANQTRVAVVNGGLAGDILGGQYDVPDGVLLVSIATATSAGSAIVLSKTLDAGISYPRQVTVTKWSDISTIVAKYDLVGDGSAIVGMMPLGEQWVIYRETMIYIGRYTGDAANPFVFVPRFPNSDQTVNVPIWGDCIANLNGEFHVYPGTGNRFYKFDGISWPSIHDVTDAAKELFFESVKITDECFVVSNPITKEQLFCQPYLTFAFDTEFKTVSEIDAVLVAGASVRKPGASDQWFILAIENKVYTYGLVVNAVTPILTFLRDGVAPTAILKSGLISAGLMTDEKMLLGYAPVLASQSPDSAIEVQLYSTYNPSAALTALLIPVESLPTPSGECYFTCGFQEMFFADEITLVTEEDVDFQLSQRTFEFDRIGEARGVTRSVSA